MSRYDNQNLFGSGPHEFFVHGVAQRHTEHTQPGADGVAVTTLGKTGRTIEQTGTLLADNVGELQQQIETIEAAMDGRNAVLIDHLGRSWSGVLMLAFKPASVRKVGLRLAVDYETLYMQVQP